MTECKYSDITKLPMFLTVKDVQNILGIHNNSAYELVKQPGFPAVRVSDRRIVIPRDRFIKWIDQRADLGL